MEKESSKDKNRRLEEAKEKLRNYWREGYRVSIADGNLTVINMKGRHISKVKNNDFLDLFKELVDSAKR